jgi:hypothetical protein
MKMNPSQDELRWNYPKGPPEHIAHPGVEPITDESCRIPLLTKYLIFAQMDKPSDEIVNDIYTEAVRVAKLWAQKNEEARKRWFKPEEYATLEGCSKIKDEKSKISCRLFNIANHPQTTRLDKVLAVEAVMSGEHTVGKGGTMTNQVCPSLFGDTLMAYVLELLARKK